ncbi:MAG: aldehyde dehydrogenase family protein [Acidobacteriota bacterium]
MKDFLQELGIETVNSGVSAGTFVTSPAGPEVASIDPATGEAIAMVRMGGLADHEQVVTTCQQAFASWRSVPAPARGQVVRVLGEEFRRHKSALGALIAHEMGKIRSEGEGEVQEMIDIADFAVGLSRQLYGKTMHSERPGHRMYEQWHPLGVIGIISAFNFPGAVWAWNAMVAAVCGDTMIWKPSSKVPLTAIAIQHLCDRVLAEAGHPGVMALLAGSSKDIGQALIDDRRLPLISATGSCRMGETIGRAVASRFGRSILELGGNNGIIVLDDADLDMAQRGILFGAVGTAGQRCTTTRRLLVQKGVARELSSRLVKAYGSVRIGDPLDPDTLMGPLIDHDAVQQFRTAIEQIRAEGGEILTGGHVLDRPGSFVEPTLVKAHPGMTLLQEETFAPICYLLEVEDLDEAIELHNGVRQGLSSAIFTNDLKAAEQFLSHAGSDCGIANVNIGTSGAEIGGAFGGEKETGGGREAGSDAWKGYMRRQTSTINWSDELPLAQGVSFD